MIKTKLKKIIAAIITAAAVLPYAQSVTNMYLPFESEAYAQVSDNGFEYALTDDNETIRITNYSGTSGDIIIPSSIDGHEVSEIGDNAFSYNHNITSVTIENGVKKIGMSLFCGCQNLNSVTIPKSVTSIGQSAFSGCTALETVDMKAEITRLEQSIFANCSSLKEIVLPNTITDIGYNVFSNCSALESITLPIGIENVSYGIFYGCTSLENINIPDGNEKYYSSDGVLYERQERNYPTEIVNVLKIYPSGRSCAYTVPDGVYAVGMQAFAGSEVTGISFADSVKVIDSYAFENCNSLTMADLSGIEDISYSAFARCSKLADVTLSDKLTSINSSLFNNCELLTSITLPLNITSIGDSAFSGTSISSIHLPKLVQSVGEKAFPTTLTEITVDKDNEYFKVENGALINIKDISYEKKDNTLVAYPSAKTMENCVIPDGVEHIAANVFMEYASMKSVAIPNSVKTIGNYAFSCTGLEAVSLPNGLETISTGLFNNCTKLANIEIPNSVKKIDSYAFYNCSALEEITIPANVTSFGYDILPNSITIKGYNGTAAENYANKNNISFVSLGDIPIEEITVENSKELISAIGSYRNITLKDGIYELPESIMISSCIGLTIKAENSGFAEILTQNGSAPVVRISNSSDITLGGIILGHDSPGYHIGGCGYDIMDEYNSGHVIYADSSENVHITSCDLYGCGIIGVYLTGVKGFTADSCIIRDCMAYAVRAYSYDETSVTKFTNCVISGNAYDRTFASTEPCIKALSKVTFENCLFINNNSETFTNNNENVTLESCKQYDNIWQENGEPKLYGVCLNGVTWQIVNENEKNILKIGYSIPHDDNTVTESIQGVVPTYSSSSIPWKGLEFDELDTAAGVEYEPVVGGSCGTNAKWKYNFMTHELSITGMNDINDYDTNTIPWKGYLRKIEKITIDEGITGIGSYNFYDTYALKSIQLPSTIEKIGRGAFMDSGIESIVLPSAIKSIAKNAFESCTCLTIVQIPATLEKMYANPFTNCYKLNEINVIGNGNYSSKNGILFADNGQTLAAYPCGKTENEYSVPEGVTSILDYAFYNVEGLTKITLPSTLNKIGESAFSAVGISEIVIPENVTDIAPLAFRGCQNLISVTIKNSETSFTDDRYDYGIFSYCGDSLVIYSLQNSNAQIYAAEYGIQFKLIGGADAKPVEFAGKYGDMKLNNLNVDIYGRNVALFLEAENLSGEKRVVTVFAAAYDTDGNIIGITCKKTPVKDDYLYQDMNISCSSTDEFALVRVFILGGSGNVTPLCNAASS